MIHIITHPLIGNYGGVLQAYALQHALNKKGYPVTTCEEIPSYAYTDYFSPGKRIKWEQLKIFIKLILKRISYVPSFLNRKRAKRFKQRFMNIGKRNNIKPDDRFIVGSDQVWRLLYTRTYSGATYFFLDFATEEQRKKSIAYAASFGTDEWEGTPEETETCRKLIQDFKAVSVREESGIKLCHDVFDVHATQMPDPTFLLQSEDYNKIIKNSRTWRPAKQYIAAYVLDSSLETEELLQETVEKHHQYLQRLLPCATAKKIRDRIPMSIPQWLRSIRDCEYLITDSFHGCVFSIIFNKPFICIGNAARGSSRFDTLFKTFGLQERMLTNATSQLISELISHPIDWNRINILLEKERERGLIFLQQNLA